MFYGEIIMSALIERLENMLASGQDNLLLRFGLGKAYAQSEQWDLARQHLLVAVEQDALHSSSWFWLGRVQYEAGLSDQARSSLERAVQVAEQKGDQQTIKMAQVFLRRLDKQNTSENE